MFLMIDNYDSFVYNLVRYFEELGQEIVLYKNDEISIDEIKGMAIEGIVISPGPKTPMLAGISLDIIRELKGVVPIFGVCLGVQAIAVAFGGLVMKGKEPAHGVNSLVFHHGKSVFRNLKSPLLVTRYHSLVVDRESLPSCFEVTCETEDGVIMGIAHRDYPICGVQFHPEAELSECGKELLDNFIHSCKVWK